MREPGLAVDRSGGEIIIRRSAATGAAAQ
jgi:hypothetical protein